MEAIILAGGFGTRLRPLTYTRSKSLLPILNKPMIAYLMDSLPKEVTKVIIAVNYRKEQIETYLKEQDWDREIIVNDEPEPLGTGGAVKFAEQHVTGPFFVLNSDIICSLNLSEMIKFHQRCKAISTISLWPIDNVTEFGVADVKENGLITRFVEKPKQEEAPSNLINAGAYLLEHEIMDYIEPRRLVSMEKEIFPQIIKDTEKFYGFTFQGYWMDIGRISSYINVNTFLLKQKGFSNYVSPTSDVMGNISRCSIGEDAMIEKYSSLKSTIVYKGALIEDHVTSKNCVIGENCVVGRGSTLRNVVLGDNEKLHDNSQIENQLIWTQPIPNTYPKKQIGNVIGE